MYSIESMKPATCRSKRAARPRTIITRSEMYEWMNATLWVAVVRAARCMDCPSLFRHLAGTGGGYVSASVTSRPANRSRTATDRSASRDVEPPSPAQRCRARQRLQSRKTRGGLCRGRRSNASCRGIGEISNRVVGEHYNGNDDLDTAAITEDDAVDDGMEAQEREDVTLELCIVDTVRPHLVRAGAGERRQHDQADQKSDDCDGSAHHVSTLLQEP